MYEQSFIRPSLEVEKPFLKILGVTGWEMKMTEMLFPGAHSEGIEDAKLADGTEVYNFVGCNINRIRETFPRINGADIKTVVLAESWMAGTLHGLFGKESVEIVEISDSDIALIAEAISKS